MSEKKEPIYDPKHGYIVTPNGRVQHSTYTWTERPQCPECKCEMSENDRVVNGKLVFKWWCSESSCEYHRRSMASEIEVVAQIKNEQAINYSRFGIPAAYDRKEFGGLRDALDPQIAEIKRFIKSPANMLITGGTGTGKTHLAVAAIKGLVNQSTTDCQFVSANNLIMQLNSVYDDGSSQTLRSMTKRYIDYYVLCIDDFGAEKLTENTRTVMYSIIDGRIMDEKPTLITTNMTLKEIADNYGERIASRLSGYQKMSCGNQDYRSRKNV